MLHFLDFYIGSILRTKAWIFIEFQIFLQVDIIYNLLDFRLNQPLRGAAMLHLLSVISLCQELMLKY